MFNNQGIETKQFHIRDGMGIRLWQRAGYKFGVITGRSSHIVKIRAAELDVEIVRQTAEDKLPVALEILNELGARAAPGLLHRRRPARSAGDAGRGAGRGRGRRLQRGSRGGALRHRTAPADWARFAKRSRSSSRRKGAGTISFENTPLERTMALASAPSSRSAGLLRILWSRLSRSGQVAGSFVAVVSAYALYWLIAVPLIEPSLEQKVVARTPEEQVDEARGAVNARQRDVAQFFAADAWELGNPAIWQSEQTRLLFKTITPQADGTVKLEPCTLLFFPRRLRRAAKAGHHASGRRRDHQVRPADRSQERRLCRSAS